MGRCSEKWVLRPFRGGCANLRPRTFSACNAPKPAPKETLPPSRDLRKPLRGFVSRAFSRNPERAGLGPTWGLGGCVLRMHPEIRALPTHTPSPPASQGARGRSDSPQGAGEGRGACSNPTCCTDVSPTERFPFHGRGHQGKRLAKPRSAVPTPGGPESQGLLPAAASASAPPTPRPTSPPAHPVPWRRQVRGSRSPGAHSGQVSLAAALFTVSFCGAGARSYSASPAIETRHAGRGCRAGGERRGRALGRLAGAPLTCGSPGLPGLHAPTLAALRPPLICRISPPGAPAPPLSPGAVPFPRVPLSPAPCTGTNTTQSSSLATPTP